MHIKTYIQILYVCNDMTRKEGLRCCPETGEVKVNRGLRCCPETDLAEILGTICQGKKRQNT